MKSICFASLCCSVLVGTVVLSGCREKDDFNLTFSDLGFEERRSEAFPTNAPKTVANMAPDDVIVAVNGYPLTKRNYDELMALRLQGILQEKDISNLAAEQKMDRYRIGYIKSFQGMRMLMDEAFRTGVASTNEVIAEMVRRLKKDARRRRTTVEKSLTRKFGARRKYFLQELYASIAMDKLIADRIPPKIKVDEGFVKAAQDQITQDNLAAEATNAQIVARMKDWKNQLLTNKLDFVEVAKRFSDNPDKVDGVWGEFEEGDMDDPRVEAAVFALPLNGISDVLEDFNGYHLVKVLAITPPVTNTNGRVVRKETRKLSHIYFEKIPVSMRLDDVKMTAELKRQMHLQAVDEFIFRLSTNDNTRIEFPNGKQLFSR